MVDTYPAPRRPISLSTKATYRIVSFRIRWHENLQKVLSHGGASGNLVFANAFSPNEKISTDATNVHVKDNMCEVEFDRIIIYVHIPGKERVTIGEKEDDNENNPLRSTSATLPVRTCCARSPTVRPMIRCYSNIYISLNMNVGREMPVVSDGHALWYRNRCRVGLILWHRLQHHTLGTV
jgi:hypothetical protein